jgi:hypothetical protein
VGVRLLAAGFAALAIAATPAENGARFLRTHQLGNGGFAESGGPAYPALTAWAALGLRAGGGSAGAAGRYLVAHERELKVSTDIELALVAEASLGLETAALAQRVRALHRPSGAIGPSVNSTIWGVLGLRSAGAPVPPGTKRYLLRQQARSGGWSWWPGGAPDSNDTAAAVQALRSLGVTGRPIRGALTYLRRLQNRDGGFELRPGRGSDAQSTAWAIQAFFAAGSKPSRSVFRYLDGLQRPDGSFRYSRRYVTTPVWVTAQVLPALARRPFPLR